MAGQREAVEFNTEQWAAAMKEAIEQVTVRAEADLPTIALLVQNAARRYCPVDTGRLRSSIRTGGLQRDARGAYVEVGTNVAYAPHVEFGTDHAPMQPFLRPGFLEGARAFVRRG